VLLTTPAQAMLMGLARYATADKRWVFERARPSPALAEQLAEDPPDGVIAYVGPGLIAPLRELPCPVVNHSGQLAESPIPRVMVDDRAAGRLAAEHLMDRGHRRLAMVAFEAAAFSVRRLEGFREAGEAAGCVVADWNLGQVPGWDERHRDQAEDEAIGGWLGEMGFPVGVFGVNDEVAWRVSSVCEERGVDVPEQVAVLGMDNVPGFCEICHPSLSSVVSPWDQVGYEAAALLDRLMAGEPPPDTDVLVPPAGVVTRRSTDAFAVEDPKIARSLRFIRDHAHEGVSIDEVADDAGLPRRTMEKQYRRLLGRTPLEEVNRVKIELAKQLLADPALSIETVATRAGFDSLRWLNQKFREHTGLTPAKWRKR